MAGDLDVLCLASQARAGAIGRNFRDKCRVIPFNNSSLPKLERATAGDMGSSQYESSHRDQLLSTA